MSVTCSPNPVCSSQTSALSVSGTLNGGQWFWYDSGCGAGYIATGSLINVSESNTTNYFVRQELGAIHSGCAGVLLNIASSSVPAYSLNAFPDTLCSGYSTTITATGGSLGTAAQWYWYTSACGGSNAGTGSQIICTPSVSLTYYCRAEGECNTTSCLSTGVYQIFSLADPAYASASPDTISQGHGSTLSAGSSPSQGEQWRWYANSCGTGSTVGSGNSIVVYPSITTSYYLTGKLGTCYSGCVSLTVTVILALNNPSSISASVNPVCNGQSSVLSVTGNLNGGQWFWYYGSCGGLFVATGDTITVNPAVSVNYYVRQESGTNYSTCTTYSLIAGVSSVQPSTAFATPSTLCRGTSSTLSFSGGILGTFAGWFWYTGSCGGIYASSGISIVQAPSASTIYYLRAEGVCNTTSCISIKVTVLVASIPATSATGLSPVCYGSLTTLTLTGGSLGTSAYWVWYYGSCGGNSFGINSPIYQQPSVTITYYVRAEGTCNTTSCLSTTVVVDTVNIPASSATSIINPVCNGSATTMMVNGGKLSPEAVWKWFTSSCGGNYLNSSSAPVITPTATTTYWVRAEGKCNTTVCISVTVNVYTLPVLPAMISSSPSPPNICQGQLTTLRVLGGSLGTAPNTFWFWYNGGCGANNVGVNQIFLPNDTNSSVYYVRAEGPCITTQCLSITVTVEDSSFRPSSITASTTILCPGYSTVLGITGGYTGTGANWFWYSGTCGGTYIATGSSQVLQVSATTTYYVRSEGYCNTTNCASRTILVNSLSVSPSSFSINHDTVCNGNPTTLSILGGNAGTGAIWYWYTGSCGGSLAGTGTSLRATPSVTTNYYVMAEGICNSTSCIDTIVTVNFSSIQADSLSASNVEVCSGQQSIVTLHGGILGSGAKWYWYTSSCGGNFETYSTSIPATLTIYPSTTTTYWARAQGYCNTTICVSKTIVVHSNSVAANYAFASSDTICPGDTIVLGISGGIKGTSANWNWYSGSCSGTYIISGSSPRLSPALTTTFFVYAQGLCNSTHCVSITVNVSIPATPIDSIVASAGSICSGSSVSLSISGGNRGTGGKWCWYSGSCHSSIISTASTLVFSPTVNTTYFAQVKGLCNTTNCVSKTIIVNNFLTPPVAITVSEDTICSGNTVFAGVAGQFSGGSLQWFSGQCNGSFISSASSLALTPTITSVYFVRAEGNCNTTSCISRTVFVNTLSAAPSMIAILNDSICSGDSSVLSVYGGITGSGADWYWYSGSCGGTQLSTGAMIITFPSVSSDYFVRAEGLCNTTICLSKNITVLSLPSQPLNVIGNSNPQPGSYQEYYVIPDSNVIQYQWNAPLGWTGTGYSNSVTFIVGTNSGTISVTPSNYCGFGFPGTLDVYTGSNVSGNFLYDNTYIPLDSVFVYLVQNGNVIDSTRTDLNGYYTFSNVANGLYNIRGKTHKTWAGVNATDAVKVKRHFAGAELLTTSLRLHAADVNLTNSINTTDAVKITRRFVGSDTIFTRGDWLFEKPFGGDTINVSAGMNDTIAVLSTSAIQDIMGLCVGDVNGSNYPAQGAKKNPKVILNYYDMTTIEGAQYLRIPLNITSDINIGAVSLILKYPKDLLRIINVKFAGKSDEDERLIYNIKGDEIRMGWFENDLPCNLKTDDTLFNHQCSNP